MTLYTNTAWLAGHHALSALQATGTDTCTGPAPQWGQLGLSTPTILPQPLAWAWEPLPQEGGGARVLGVGRSPAAAVDPGAPLHSRKSDGYGRFAQETLTMKTPSGQGTQPSI